MTAYKHDSDLVIESINTTFKGGTIIGAQPMPEEDGHQWYQIYVQLLDGTMAYLEPSIDPEGNAPGFLFSGKVE